MAVANVRPECFDKRVAGIGAVGLPTCGGIRAAEDSMPLFRVLFPWVLAVAALSLFTASASAQSRLPCQPFPGCFFGGGQDEDDDDDNDDGNGSSSVPIGDFTFGAGTAAFPPVVQVSMFRFAAASGPGGENPSGFADATSVFGERFAGPVTCLRVEGRRAAFEVDSTVGRDAVFFVGDFGPAGVGDEFNFDPIGQADATCPDPGSREQSLVSGDIVVGDNEPVGGRGDDDDDDGNDDD
jgi:hypothetical protein